LDFEQNKRMTQVFRGISTRISS